MTRNRPRPLPSVYLDNAATTLLAPEAALLMQEVSTAHYANPSTIHGAGSRAARQVEWARNVLADRLGCAPDEVYFTCGGTEANNLALKGVLLPRLRDRERPHLIVSAIEHSSVLETASWLEGWGVDVTRIAPDPTGLITAARLAEALRPSTALVSIVHGSNEIGTLQPIADLGRLCREAGALFHTDACQSFPREPVQPTSNGLDLITINAHKAHGPKGVGALYIRNGTALEPLLHGGGQENGLRSGTLNTAGICGFARAVELVTEADTEAIRALRDQLINDVLSTIPCVRLTGARHERLSTIASFTFNGLSGREMQRQLDLRGITVGTGSACAAGSLRPSPILLALGLDAREASGALRLSLSRYSTREHVTAVVAALTEIVQDMDSVEPKTKEPVQTVETPSRIC